MIDDDPHVWVSVQDATVQEGASGTTNAEFLVTLSAAPKQTVTLGWTTRDGTAKAGDDYVPGTGSVSFAAGQTAQFVRVAVRGDSALVALGSNGAAVIDLAASPPAVRVALRPPGVVTSVDRGPEPLVTFR